MDDISASPSQSRTTLVPPINVSVGSAIGISPNPRPLPQVITVPNGTMLSFSGNTAPVVGPEFKVSEPSDPSVTTEELDGSPPLFDPHFLLSILDPRDMVVPMTIRRAIGLMVLLAAIGGIIYYRDDVVSTLDEWAKQNSLFIMLLLYLYEPLMYTCELITTPKYPVALPEAVPPIDDAQQLEARLLSHAPPPNHDLAVVIPCHNSAEFIADTIKAALRHVAPDQIFLMDNGRSELPSDLTKQVAHKIHPDINYFWLPNIASKNWAQLFALQYINEHRPELTLILIIDDDTRIPPNFTIRRDFLLDPGVQAIAYPIRAISPYRKQPLLVRWQDREYIKSDLHKLSLDQLGALDCPHGAAALIRRDALWKILMQKHNRPLSKLHHFSSML